MNNPKPLRAMSSARELTNLTSKKTLRQLQTNVSIASSGIAETDDEGTPLNGMKTVNEDFEMGDIERGLSFISESCHLIRRSKKFGRCAGVVVFIGAASAILWQLLGVLRISPDISKEAFLNQSVPDVSEKLFLNQSAVGAATQAKEQNSSSVVVGELAQGRNHSSRPYKVALSGTKLAHHGRAKAFKVTTKNASASKFQSPTGFSYALAAPVVPPLRSSGGKITGGATAPNSPDADEGGGANEIQPWEKKLRDATCALDTGEGATMLGVVGTAIKDMRDACPKGQRKSGQCALGIEGVTNPLTAIASFISGAAANCGSKVNTKAGCAEDVTSILAIMQDVADTASSIKETCNHKNIAWFPVMPPGLPPIVGGTQSAADSEHNEKETAIADRRLGRLSARPSGAQILVPPPGLGGMLGTTPEDKFNCAVESILSGWESLNAGLAVDSAAQGCKTDDEHKGCVSDISTVVTAILAVTNFLLVITEACTTFSNAAVVCAADLTGIAGIVGDLTGTSSSLSTTCDKGTLEDSDGMDIIITPVV